MELLTRKKLAKGSANRWSETYCSNGAWPESDHNFLFLNKKEVFEKLLALPENPEPDDVDRCIGNGSWTSLRCDECGVSCDSVAMVGEPPDYESATAMLCEECVVKALKLIRGMI